MVKTELLSVEGLRLTVAHSQMNVVKGISFTVAPGEIVGIVGESGSGKTLAARAVMGLEPPAIRRTGGTIRFEGKDIAQLSPGELRKLRGARVGMVFQEPMTSLNPSMLIGRQLDEGLALHRKLSPEERRTLILDMLRRVGLKDPEGALQSYPHQFSGGMRQRIMLASVMLLQPALLIADEPTTALDALVQRDVLELMVELTRARGTAVLMISHDLAMVARYTDRIIVMQKGEIIEEGVTQDLLREPKDPYTRKLLTAMPHRLPARSITEAAGPIVEVRNLVVDYGGRQGFLRKEPGKRVLHGINLSIRPREVVALVGGSGSGKTTLGRAIAGLLNPTGGEIRFAGRSIVPGSEGWNDYRLDCQMVFQDPYSSLDPRMTIGALIREALRLVPTMRSREKTERVREILNEVGLSDAYVERYPHELSGGQRQRVAIARAVVRRPAFVIADEPVSALDVTVRAQVLDLFADLQERHGFSCLFISHDLGVVEQVADRVVVMQDGRIAEEGTRDAVFDAPQHPYTKRLLSAIPILVRTEQDGVRLRWRDEEASPEHGAETPRPEAYAALGRG
ncbi:ABC transporter ATP-binding protein [Microvirga lotononidis]|uniref:ATPase component of various ABC-type transport systems with duplicated ATPase domain n=1 Tax=Microvirga lotononidis TaxID=864069 RepID=I4YQU9_9HYPH|nr:ABC transporter ATP-binding protein [Microvirga lotononidis]EIM26341.1 ATPase component of various ABC-type transport systems with duplicated ATPase domain [Microvirga lotononidis]WQO30711.1 ABC transporter ATP-binding protein [Microvirga lotononidis]